MNRLGLLVGLAVLAVVLVAAPIPLAVTVQNPARKVTIYPNLLFAVPLNLLPYYYYTEQLPKLRSPGFGRSG